MFRKNRFKDSGPAGLRSRKMSEIHHKGPKVHEGNANNSLLRAGFVSFVVLELTTLLSS